MKNKTIFSNKLNKPLVITGILSFVLLSALVVLLVFLNQKPQTKVKAKTPTIALVNEDIASNFNHQDYNFGKSFIDLVSNDNKYNWQVVSRSVADKAYSDGSVDAVIYLPQTFSKDLLTLQDIDPTQSDVAYKIQPQVDELSEKIVQDKITSVLYDFNQNVVKMYYSSVAGNIAEAEAQMNATVGKQQNLVAGLSAQVQNPFKSSMPNYTSFISGTSSLKGINQANVTMQNSFTDSTKNLMKQTGESFSNQLPQITDYFEMQKKIAGINVDNANKGITNQAESDQTFYYQQFEGLNTDIANGLNAFYQKDTLGNETGHLADLKQKVTDYNTLIDGVKGDISDQITTLTNKRNDLLGLEADLYHQFLSQNLTVTTDNFDTFSNLQTVTNSRTALAAKLQSSLVGKDNLTGSAYLTQLQNLISSLSLTSTDYKLADLEENGTIDSATRTKYEQELQVIRQYATAFNLSSGTVTLGDVPTTDTVNQTLTRNVEITVPAGTTYNSSAFPSDVTVTAVTSTGITVNNDNSITLDNSSSTGATTFEFNLVVNLGNKSSYSFSTTWQNKTAILSTTTDTFALVPMASKTSYNQYIDDNFQTLTDLLGEIDSTSSMITTLYAKPGADYTSLLSATSSTDFQTASTSSIFNMYGNMDLTTLAIRLGDQDVQDFLTMGQSDLNKVIQTVSELNSSISKLQNNESTLQSHLPEDYFANNLAALMDWHTKTVAKIEETYKKWQQQSAAPLDIVEWSKYDSSKTELYTETSQSLYEQIQTLVTTTGKSMTTIAESSTAVKDNSPQFEELVNQATSTQKDAQNLLANTDNLVSTGTQGVDESKGFFGDFSKTLANTRTKGANTQNIYNFFATPIATTNATPKRDKVADAKKAFDARWVVVFSIGLIAGIFVMVVGQYR
ncbi:type VII secretion protein EsaA [Lactococcus raffinolactis]|uniref:Type VII secretion protein EsaA n=1 Tax=Pseudolactococcus raffinolactis TaxID=1366 RepID=A0A6H0UBK4_9LACT|nr:type VII secretion protein EsaA [Lactococcus raffinolactis]QIW52824.1 type VII secretion protein EsaA [Lactococcus raffinolactis]